MMGRYLDMLDRLNAATEHEGYDKNDIYDQRVSRHVSREEATQDFGRLNRFCRTLDALERRRPDYVDAADWQHAVEDGRRFLARWEKQAEALGWTVKDLFGLHDPPEQPDPRYRRLSRLDAAGLIWILRGRLVVALTANTAAIATPSGGTVTFIGDRWCRS